MRPYFYIIYLQAEGDLQGAKHRSSYFAIAQTITSSAAIFKGFARSSRPKADLQRSDLQARRADLQLSYIRSV